MEKYKASIQELTKNDLADIQMNNFRLNEKGYSIADEIISRYF